MQLLLSFMLRDRSSVLLHPHWRPLWVVPIVGSKLKLYKKLQNRLRNQVVLLCRMYQAIAVLMRETFQLLLLTCPQMKSPNHPGHIAASDLTGIGTITTTTIIAPREQGTKTTMKSEAIIIIITIVHRSREMSTVMSKGIVVTGEAAEQTEQTVAYPTSLPRIETETETGIETGTEMRPEYRNAKTAVSLPIALTPHQAGNTALPKNMNSVKYVGKSVVSRAMLARKRER